MSQGKIGFREVLTFTLLPGIVPRARGLVASGLGPMNSILQSRHACEKSGRSDKKP